ncbi:transmembrane protease serine 12-like isoform X2 [Ahaetulla prasina]|uniref:transmembrane protease serine 12-like isoform X2 n=1 Tax=Ahaetulla prasina TaxID=499056 RepID=UPI00264A025B|nr:transmembrane protease serine 12-like isoform X2 [Ahaetulla prasina]
MSRSFCPAAFSFWALLVLFREAAAKALPSLNLSDGCGARPAIVNITAETQSLGGGRVTQLGTWPWNPEYWRVVIGLHHLYKPHSHTKGHRVKSIIIHSGFKWDSYENDIAMFKLVKLVEYNKYIQPICLPQNSHLVTDENPCYISGWGNRKKKGKIQTVLQEAQVFMIPLYVCNKYERYKERLSTDMICAVSPTNSCVEDSGGPLMCYFPNVSKYYLIGITSFANGCNQDDYPGLYTSTISYRKWIDFNLHDKTTMNIQSILVLLTMEWVIFHLL